MHNALYRSVHRKDEGRDALPLVAFQSYEKALEVPQESEGESTARSEGGKRSGTNELTDSIDLQGSKS